MKIFTFLLSLLPAIALSQQQARPFGFQDVLLNASYEGTPEKYKSDCGSSNDKRFLFCTHKEQLEGIELVAEITFVNQHVSEIQVYYPTARHNDVWLALREKYGKEHQREGPKADWYSSAPSPDNPMPDELSLFKVAEKQPKPDGTYYKPIQYGLIEYRSMATARETYKQKLSEQERKVKSLSKGL